MVFKHGDDQDDRAQQRQGDSPEDLQRLAPSMRAASKICSSIEPSAPTNIKAISGAQPQVSLIASMKSAQNFVGQPNYRFAQGRNVGEGQDIDKLNHDIDRSYDQTSISRS